MHKLFKYYDETNEEEVCGFVTKRGKVIPVKNIHPEPTEGFQIDPKETLRYINKMEAIWHTHPNSTSVLSGEDKLCMEQWPDSVHYIIGKDGIRKYVVEDGVVINADHIPR